MNIDLYRLNSAEEVAAAGLEEYMVEPNGVTVVEWIERWLPGVIDAAPGADGVAQRNSVRFIHIEPVSESERQIKYGNPRD